MTDIEQHIPVLLDEVLYALAPKDGEKYIDCTFGLGGYSKAILKKANCFLHAIDRDINVLKYAEKMKTDFPENFCFHHAKFSDLLRLDIGEVNGIVFDIGVSSPQLDNSERGFSFSKKGKLDMGMGLNNLTAHDVINSFSETEIADIIYEYGEEPYSRRIAKAIVTERKKKIIETTTDLAEIIHQVIGNKGKTDSATKTFQAIRIFVNDELNELTTALSSAFSMLKKDGRMVVVTFHSLEDRIVKKFFNQMAGKTESVSRYAPISNEKTKTILAYNLQLVKTSNKEIERNPRSRSAKLRSMQKV